MGWTFFFMFVVLKIPIGMALWLVWWATREVPNPEDDHVEDDGGGPPRGPHSGPRRPPSGRGGGRRRGAHADAPPASPQRVRARGRRIQRQRSS